MSSTIFYRKLFIKVSETEVIPFFEAGSSNCYDCGIKNRIGRRSREWQNRTINGKTIVQHNEVLSYVTDFEKNVIENYNENHTDSQYNPNVFGWYTGLSIGGKSNSKTTYSDYKNFFMGGIKKAVTIEELVENNIVVSIHVSPYSKEKIESNGLEMKPIVYFNSTQQLIDTINEYTEYYKNVPNCFYLTTVSEYSIERFLKNNNLKRVKKEK